MSKTGQFEIVLENNAHKQKAIIKGFKSGDNGFIIATIEKTVNSVKVQENEGFALELKIGSKVTQACILAIAVAEDLKMWIIESNVRTNVYDPDPSSVSF